MRKCESWFREWRKLIDLLKILETDNNFIGGAVAAPYKQTVYNFSNKIVMTCLLKLHLPLITFSEITRDSYSANTDAAAANQ